ncbi:acyl-CoA desaturase [Oceanisphaera psychrotolerans]|uniref:Acyl-CoA desaturase n=1 Tax=Oceanisphaera psychrotolerans TaxID=1414654 RepID=A0A1J4QD83_9GAMM|nr:fatty acid desaturase [Oceanisphaera psychrotolerans]OIN04787.1 acyl-CoA desaturase [Oceanisphaera psychrotolerans]
MRKPPLLWTNLLLFSGSGLAAMVLVPWYGLTQGYDGWQWLAMLTLFSYSCLSITAGYHRLWAHKAYDAHPLLQWLFALGGALSLQNSAYHWCADHRRHHRHVDDLDKDPYSASRGLWFSHMGWMLRHYHTPDDSNIPDLKRNPILQFQHKHYLPLTLVMNIALPLLLGFWHGDIWGMLLMAGVLRLFLGHHVTFFINSLAHYWGRQPYTSKNSARDNDLLAVLTFGEGYHNFHHLFEFDYRNGIRWWHYDPTKWLIRSMSWLGLASRLRTCPQERIEQAQLERRLEIARQKILRQQQNADTEQWLALLHSEYERLLEQLKSYYQVRKSLLELKKKAARCKYEELRLKLNCDELKASFTTQRRNWLKLTTQFA